MAKDTPRNGKGDRSRIGDIKKYRDNFSEINWKKKCVRCDGTGWLEANIIECECSRKKGNKKCGQ